jgi:hypothetical protein
MSAASPIDSVEIPQRSVVTSAFTHHHLADAFETMLPEGASTDPETLARHIFGTMPAWVNALLKLRDALVRPFGIKTASAMRRNAMREGRIGLFRIYERRPLEIILGDDDSHLDFRASVFVERREESGTPRHHVVISTVVHCNNRIGRLYIFVIRPFHRMVVRSSLRRAGQRGWPPALPSSP